jgi:hypothetical protein
MSTLNTQVNPYPFEPTKPYSESAMRHYNNLSPLKKKRIDHDRTLTITATTDAEYIEALQYTLAQAERDIFQKRDESIEGAY